MRALCLTATGATPHLDVIDVAPPVLRGPTEVRIGIHAAALNHLDLWVANGAPGLKSPPLPHIVGSDGAGTVLEVGSGVNHVRPGDRVVINPGVSCGACDCCLAGEEVYCRQFGILGEHRPGTAADELVLPARNVAAIRGEWSWAAAAAFPLSTLTAWRMLTTRAGLASDEQVLIWGIGGGVAVAALQVARMRGARVAVTSSSDAKLDRARQLGAEFGINHRTSADVAGAVKRHFGSGVHVAVDSVGAPTWQQSLKALRPGGRLVTCGATGGPGVELDLRRLFWFQWSLLGSTMGTSSEFAQIVAIGDAGQLRAPVDAVYPLSDATEAYRRLAGGEQFGKLVLEVIP
ncbi:MAG TPA: zinc-binding dehydrogenase [Gemmatimonadales bacterium]|jgi:NADPH:quinone reductase-like Zn-dependent oxidoreductase